MLRNPMTDWMLPPEQEPGEFEQRWNVAPDRRMPMAEMFARAGMPGMESYGEADPAAVFGAYDKAKAAREKAAAADAANLRAEEYRSTVEGHDPSQIGGGGLAVHRPMSEDERATNELLWSTVIPQSPLDAGLAIAGGPVGGKLLRGGAAALGALFEPDEAEAGFAGKLSKTADLGALRRARTLAKEGHHPNWILDETGWEKRPDRQWRYEYSDRDSLFNPERFSQAPYDRVTYPRTPTVLKDVFEHPDLFNAYPEFADYPVFKIKAQNAFGETNRTRGGFDPEGKAFYLREDLSPEEARKVMLHEVQHAIQRSERFGTGGSMENPAVWKRGDQQLSQTLSDAEKRFNELRDQMQREVMAATPDGTLSPTGLKRWKQANPELTVEMDRMFGVMNAGGGARFDARFNAYRALQGETEARNVATRADLTPEQRFLLRPQVTEDVMREQQWVTKDRVDKNKYPTMGGLFEDRDPRLWSPISSQKLRKPLDEMEHRYTDVRTPAPRFVHPEQLVGGYGIFTPWDLSAANKTLTHVDAQQLAKPVRLHGGVGFPEANPGMAAASEQAISRRLDNQAARLTDETGKPVYIMPMTMSPSGIDASHHVADPLSQLVQTAKITKKDAKAFDKAMREEVPNWVGIKSEKFPDYIANLQGGMTTKALMADRMALAQWQAKGFPDVAAIRHATSEPALIDMPRNTTGMAISRYIPGQGLLDTPHPSYPKGVAGQYMGQLASLLPFEDAAPGIAKGLAQYNAANKAMGKKVASTPAYHLQKPHEGVPTAQFFDDEWLDNIMKRWSVR